MYCPSCGNEITVELKYCNRCGMNLTQTAQSPPVLVPVPMKLTVPTLIIGLTIVLGLTAIFHGASDLVSKGAHAAFVTWMLLFSTVTLFGCTALLIRFWTKMVSLQRETRELEARQAPPAFTPPSQNFATQLPPRMEHVGSVTEHTTRTFSPAYKDSERR